MSVTETIDQRRLAFIEAAEERRLNANRAIVRERVAARLKSAPGTLENLQRGRLKRVCKDLAEAIRLEFIRAVEREIGLLTHELEIARAGRGDGDPCEIGEIEAHLGALREILARRKGAAHG